MLKRLPFEESCRALQKQQVLESGDIPAMPATMPHHDDEVLGISFFRQMLAEVKFENMTLSRTFFGRSEIRECSFGNTDLTESRANWNDFIDLDFTNAILENSDLRACLFENVNFRSANLGGVDFRYCGFKSCDFKDADLTGAKLTTKVGASLKLSIDQQSVVDWQEEDGDEPEGG
jgi:uncharacterized protein YjbI with pentapeptide repeats